MVQLTKKNLKQTARHTLSRISILAFSFGHDFMSFTASRYLTVVGDVTQCCVIT